MDSGLTIRQCIHRRHHTRPPAHHVVAAADPSAAPSLSSYLFPNQEPEKLYDSQRSSVFETDGPSDDTLEKHGGSAEAGREEGKWYVRTGFRNPWDSWHKPTIGDVWNGVRWGGAADESGEDRAALAIEEEGEEGRQQQHSSIDDALKVVPPDFSISEPSSTKVTWLGHATALLQLPIARHGASTSEPLRVLFDPIFSARCSPTQYVGPQRTFAAPCQVQGLPRIDVAVISHSHYDHLDYESIVQLWQKGEREGHKPRFMVPLGNKAWFASLGLGIDDENVVELDWWDEAWLAWSDTGAASPSSTDEITREEPHLRLICTPAQHGSGRYGLDSSTTLWASWTLEHHFDARSEPLRVFFGGDTGYQFHGSPPDLNDTTSYAPCPAFAQIRRHLGAPVHLCLLPISVGATFSFVKSYDFIGVIPTMDEGLTSANHMGPQDAVRVARILGDRHTLALAIHWGTFVGSLGEVQRSMRELRHACDDNGVDYVRDPSERGTGTRMMFACLNHGDGLCYAFPR